MYKLEKLKNYLVNSNGCHIWQGSKFVSGYAQLRDGKKTKRVHRLVWEQANGPISKGLIIMHKCDTPDCINLSHLAIGTQLDNIKDRDNKNRGSYKIQRGEDNGHAKLTNDKVKFIRVSDKTGKELATLMNVSESLISEVKTYKIWRHIK